MSGFGTDWAQRFFHFFVISNSVFYVCMEPIMAFCTFFLFLICGLLSSGALYSECWHTEMGLSIESILSLIDILDCVTE